MTRVEPRGSQSETPETDADAKLHRHSSQDHADWFLFRPALIARCLAIVIGIIVVSGALANYAIYNVAPDPDHPIADVLKRFDLGHEPSIPAFYSATVMLIASAFLVFLGRFDQTGPASRRRHWYVLAILLLCLAIDETVMFHEMATAALDLLNLSGPFYFSWVIPGFIFAAMVGISLLRFLLTLNRRTCKLIILSGVVFVSGAIGMELIAGIIFSSAESELAAKASLSHVIAQAIEEGLEMAGMAIFLFALVDYANISGITIGVRQQKDLETVEA